RREQHAGKLRAQELMPVAAGAVQDQNRIGHIAMAVALRLAERGVMQAQIGQQLAGAELEVVDDEIAFERQRRRRGLRLGIDGAQYQQQDSAKTAQGTEHRLTPQHQRRDWSGAVDKVKNVARRYAVVPPWLWL